MKRWLKFAPIALLIIGVLLWLGFSHPTPKNSVQPYTPQDTTVRDTSPTTPLVADNPATNTPGLPTPPVADPPIIDIDSSSYPAGTVNSQTFNTPEGGGNTWAVSFSYSAPRMPDNDVIVRVIDATSHSPVNFVDLSPADTSGQFSFVEPNYPNPVYIEVTAGAWHLRVDNITASNRPQYPLVRTQTLSEQYCVKNAQGQCNYGP